jgi:hypothetical protein
MILSPAQIADARDWAKTRRAFDTDGLARELAENGVDVGAHNEAGKLIARWVAAGEVKTAGGSRQSRAYRWLHASAE